MKQLRFKRISIKSHVLIIWPLVFLYLYLFELDHSLQWYLLIVQITTPIDVKKRVFYAYTLHLAKFSL